MSSLNRIVSEIVHAVGQPNNYALRENVRSLVIHTRNELIRHSMEQHGYVDSGLQQKYEVSIKKIVDGTEEDVTNITPATAVIIYRTVNKVPRPTRFTSNLPFLRVSTGGYFFNKEIPYIKETSTRFKFRIPGLKGQASYDYINDYIYIYPTEKKVADLKHDIDKIIIESVFEYPAFVAKENGQNNNTYSFDDDDNEWFIPEDMIGQIKDIIIKRDLLSNQRETNEIPNTVKVN